MLKCPQCQEYSLVQTGGKYSCDNFWCGYEWQEAEPLWAPSPFDNKEYGLKKIYPTGKGSDKYYWFICTPNFPSEQYKVTNPHCHARKNDWSGEARISLEPIELKVKLGKISKTDQNEIKKLVQKNYSYIYQEWQEVWIR